MAKNTFGGGAKTNVNGLRFEQETNIKEALSNINVYNLKENKVLYQNSEIALIVSKHALYKEFLQPRGINYKEFISKQLLPDEAIFVEKENTMYIIEKKFQNGNGSVDEKLQTCDFKLKQYKKLFSPLEINVKYVYILNEWFKDDSYADVLEYIESVGCYYFFDSLPLDFLKLPY